MVISKIDVFGASYEFTVFNKSKFKTVHGGLLTVMACMLMGVITYLFGRDFFYKLNPKIFSKQEIPERPRLIVPSNKNFSVMWKIEQDDTSLVPPERTVFFPRFEYTKYSRNSEGNWELEKRVYPSPKKCEDSSNKDNPQISNLALDVWHCIDWDEVTEKLGEQAKYGGQWDDEGPLYLIRLDFLTCPFDYDTLEFDMTKCSTVDSISDSLFKGTQYFSFNIPTYTFDTTDFDNPVKQDYKYVFFRASSRMSFTKYFYLMQETIFDDRGWTLEDNLVREAISFSETVSITRFVGDSDYKASPNQNYFSVLIYFTKDSRLHFRSYIKTQELFANIGGILKLIVMVFGFVSRVISREMLEVQLINRFSERKEPGRVRPLRGNSQTNNSAASFKANSVDQIKVSFFKILGYKVFCMNSEMKNSINKRKMQILKRIDVTELIEAASSTTKSNNSVITFKRQ